jgi:signal transduction histidine kinase
MDVDAARRFAATFVTDTTNPPTPRPRWLLWRGHDLVEIADVLTALICFAISNSTLASQNGRRLPGGQILAGHPRDLLLLFAFVNCAPLVLRTRFPLSAWLASAVAIILTNVLIAPVSSFGFLPAALLVNFLCLYAVTVRCQPRVTVAAAVVTVTVGVFVDPDAVFAAIFLTAVPLLLGAVVRQRRSGERQLAEQELRHSGERALLEERQRIARELHDVVAHHMSVIAIQAEAAPYKTADPPPELVESFGDIRSSALAGLTELRRVLGVLRDGGRSTAPQPGLGELDTLLDSARNGGVSVTATSSGDPVTLPEGVDLSAYRIVQEALSNAMRHAPGSHVEVHVGYRPGGLAVDVRNDHGRVGGNHMAHTAGGGHGIIGMRERATMLGGSLDAGPTDDGGFLVTAVLPTSPEEQDAAVPEGKSPAAIPGGTRPAAIPGGTSPAAIPGGKSPGGKGLDGPGLNGPGLDGQGRDGRGDAA